MARGIDAWAIEARALRKTFVKKRSVRELVTHPFRRAERVRALRGVDLQVREGEIFGLLGPNGAGKTTLLKILSCLVLPDSGSAAVGGVDTAHEWRVKSSIGLVHADERSFYWRLSARENLRFFARLYNVDGRRIDARIEELLDKVDMTASADRRFSDYSSGMKQRIAIARALLHDPPILLMDEPTRSLDPSASLALRAFIDEELNKRDGKTILLATHNLLEAQALSDHIAILIEGQVREVGTVEQVRRWGVAGRQFELELDAGADLVSGPYDVLTDRTVDGRRKVTVTAKEDAGLTDLLKPFVEADVTVHACDRVDPDLEDAFARILASEEGRT